MADEITTPAAAPAAASTPAPAPVPAAATVAAVPVAVTPVVVEAPAAEAVKTEPPAVEPVLDLGGVEPAADLEAADKIAAEAKVKKEAADKAAADAAAAADGKPISFKPDPDLGMSEDDTKAWGDVMGKAAKAAGIAPEAAALFAQALADQLASNKKNPEVQKTIKEQADKARSGQLKKQVADDLAAARALPNLGGANIEATIKSARSVLSSSKEGVAFSKWLQDNGHNANPVVLAHLAQIAATRSDDSTSSRVAVATPAPKRPAEPESQSTEAWSRVGTLNSKKSQATK